jgi:hypothetical protein
MFSDDFKEPKSRHVTRTFDVASCLGATPYDAERTNLV